MSTAAQPPKVMQKQANPPNQCLYVTNINDKISKPDLRRALYGLFTTYGPVLDVVALKTSKMRGQAHIVYRDVQTSTQAMRALQRFEFFGKEMQISYGKGKSNIISRLDGTARMPELKAEAAVSTDLQKSIFNAPSIASSLPPPASAGLPKIPNGVTDAGVTTPQGTKRPREDESDEEDVPMEEDEEAAMEESDED